jgi:alpha-L-fucosidase 2
MTTDELWYRQPALTPAEALPLGNGRSGAMLYGGTGRERVDLNADTLWSGLPYGTAQCADPPSAHLAPLRDAVLHSRDYDLADDLSHRMQGPFGQAYQPLGTLTVDTDAGEGCQDYRRALDLDGAVHTVMYRRGKEAVVRESFLSAPAGVLVMRLAAEGTSAVSFTARLASPHQGAAARPADADSATVVLTGRAPAHLAFDEPAPLTYRSDAGTGFAAALHVEAVGGTREVGADGTVTVHGARSAVLRVALATGYRGWDVPPAGPAEGCAEEALKVLAAAVATPYEELYAEHVADHRALYRRVALRLGAAAPAAADVPTDERLAAAGAGAADPGLAALLFAYGRYLLIASSRPGGQPATLQGVWNHDTTPPWNSNWTVNINLQMNYWPAEVTALPECHEPLLRLVEELAVPGARTARDFYGCRGWTAHHNVDLWRLTDPVSGSPSWAAWPMGAAWLCAHLWQHYEFGGDRAFLARIYPVLRDAALFLHDFLVQDADGRLVTCPSTSPEHRFRSASGRLVAVGASATMDYWLIGELFGNCIRAAHELGADDDFTIRLREALSRLRPPATGADGRLLEWSEDVPEEDPGHRHFSHLYGLFPGRAVNPRTTPELAAAAGAALRRRLAGGSGSTGWSAAWAAALAARLGDAETAHRLVTTLVADHTTANLLGKCPPETGQIDATFGATAAIAEMLLQETPGALELLPALPAAWPEGEVRGLRARGGIGVGIRWRDGVLAEAHVTVDEPRSITVLLPLATPQVEVTAVEHPDLHLDVARVDGQVAFDADGGVSYLIRPSAG